MKNLLPLILSASLAWLLSGLGAADAHDKLLFTIEYKDGKFAPDRLEVPQGATISFANLGAQPVWPASNIHPTHQILPEFDPQRPLAAGETWSFRFDKAGTWRFHNHLSPGEGGVISVIGDAVENLQPIHALDPNSVHFEPLPALTGQQTLAWLEDKDETVVVEAVRRYGPASTVKVIAEAGVDLHVDCHQRAHVVGRAAYKLLGPLAFVLSSHECMSGSFHGAMEAMLRERGAQHLGEDVTQMCGFSRNAFFRHQCVHGAGHGLMAWTDYQLPEALGLCDQLKAGIDRNSCYSGVFMENIAGGLSGQGMGVHTTKYLSEDPNFPCNAIDEKYVVACYAFQTSRMLRLFKKDFAKISAACEQAPPAARLGCFRSMGRDVDSIAQRRFEEAFQDCSHTKDQSFHETCLVGVVQNKFWEASGAEEATDFCRSLADRRDKEACYSTILSQAGQVLLTAKDMQNFCARIEPGYHIRIPAKAVPHWALEKLFGIAPNDQTKNLTACHRPLPPLDLWWAKLRS